MRKGLICFVLPLAALVIGACGDDDGGGSPAGGGESAGRQVYTGGFELVDRGPRGAGPIAGRAELITSAAGSRAEIRLADLEPGTAYRAYLHAEPCDQADPGGQRFEFEGGGSDSPVGELDLAFESDDDGTGFAEGSSDQVVPDPSSRSIVIYREFDEDGAPKIACAEFG